MDEGRGHITSQKSMWQLYHSQIFWHTITNMLMYGLALWWTGLVKTPTAKALFNLHALSTWTLLRTQPNLSKTAGFEDGWVMDNAKTSSKMPRTKSTDKSSGSGLFGSEPSRTTPKRDRNSRNTRNYDIPPFFKKDWTIPIVQHRDAIRMRWSVFVSDFIAVPVTELRFRARMLWQWVADQLYALPLPLRSPESVDVFCVQSVRDCFRL